MRQVILVPLLLLECVAGCVGDDPVPASSPADGGAQVRSCASHTGTVVATFTERVGTCGPLRNVTGSDQMTSTYASAPTAPLAPCAGTIRSSPNGCDESYDTSCPSVDATSTYTMRGTLTWNTEGTIGEGDLEIATSKCKSTYRVAAKKS